MVYGCRLDHNTGRVHLCTGFVGAPSAPYCCVYSKSVHSEQGKFARASTSLALRSARTGLACYVISPFVLSVTAVGGEVEGHLQRPVLTETRHYYRVSVEVVHTHERSSPVRPERSRVSGEVEGHRPRAQFRCRRATTHLYPAYGWHRSEDLKLL